MKKIIGILVLSLLFIGNVNSFNLIKYRAGDEIQNEVYLNKVLRADLSPGIWTVIEKGQWKYNAFSGNYIFVIKEVDGEISEYYNLSYLDTSGKRISDVNAWLYEIIYKNKYDGCYQRPEYYLLELFSKGSTTNCLIVRHIDANKELYNPDDKSLAYLEAPLIGYIEDNSIIVPEILLRSEHLIFSRTSGPKLYSVVHGINPKFFNGPNNKFITEDTSEYHPLNINKHHKHKKFMNDFIKTSSLSHMKLENRVKLKQYQKLDLAKYSPEKKIINNQKKSNKINNINNKLSNEDIKRLKELKKLLDDGILTQEEFNSQKKKLLK